MNNQQESRAHAIVDEVLYAQAIEELNEFIENASPSGEGKKDSKKDGSKERHERFSGAVIAVLEEAGLPTDNPPVLSSVHRIAVATNKMREVQDAKFEMRLRVRALEALSRPTEQAEGSMTELLRTEEAIASYTEAFANTN